MTGTAADVTSQMPGPSIKRFEALDMIPAEFNHEAHVYVAWCYLRDHDLLTSIDRYRSALRRLTQKFGVPEKYHETITWFYLIAVAERATGEAGADWKAFRSRNPELFEQKPAMIRRYYSRDRLMSAQAKNSFVLPDMPIPDHD